MDTDDYITHLLDESGKLAAATLSNDDRELTVEYIDGTPLQWLEREIGKRFPDDLSISVPQLRVRVAALCFEMIDLIERSRD